MGLKAATAKPEAGQFIIPTRQLLQTMSAGQQADSGTLTGTIIANDTTGTLQAKYVFTNNSDKSGEVKIYTGTQLTLDATWTSSGSGQYTEWDDQGNLISNGSGS